MEKKSCRAADAKPDELGHVNGRVSLPTERKSSLLEFLEEVLHLQVKTIQMLASLADQQGELMAYLVDNEKTETDPETDEEPAFLDGTKIPRKSL
jgi:hypothetical protein